MLRGSEDVALSLVAGLVREGGATAAVRVNDGVPSVGFVVAVSGHGFEVAQSALHPADVVAWLGRERGVFAHPGVFAGVWVDGSGRVYFDAVQVFASVDDALLAAVASGQVAVWDLSVGAEVWVPAYAGVA